MGRHKLGSWRGRWSGLLALVVVLGIAIHPASGQVRFPLSLDLPERLTDTTSGELVKGKTVTLSATVRVIFISPPPQGQLINPLDTVNWKYFPLAEDSGPLLVEDVRIDCPPGLTAKIKSAVATRKTISFRDGTGKGWEVTCEVEIGTLATVKPGDYNVRVYLDSIKDISTLLKAERPTVPPVLSFPIKLWASEEARLAEQKAKLAAEEKARVAAQEQLKKEQQQREEVQRLENQRREEVQRLETQRREATAAQEQWQFRLLMTGFAVLASLPLFGVAALFRWQWRKVRPLLTDGGNSVDPPGRIGSRLAAWDAAFRTAIGQAKQTLATGPSAWANALGSMTTPAVEEAVRSAVEATVREGIMQSRLLASGGSTVYVLSVPELTTHCRSLRRCAGLNNGLLDHVASIRRMAQANNLHCLIVAIAPDAHAARLAVWCESADGRLVSKDLFDDSAEADNRPVTMTGEWDIPLDLDTPAK